MLSKVCADLEQSLKGDMGPVEEISLLLKQSRTNQQPAPPVPQHPWNRVRSNVSSQKMVDSNDKNRDAVAASKTGRNKDLGKTRMCVNIIKKGKCWVGSNCEFAHSESEIRETPDLTKTQLCTKFMTGNCTKKNCSYAHGEAELVNRPSFKKQPCMSFGFGKCRNGNSCGFRHDGVDNNLPKQSPKKQQQQQQQPDLPKQAQKKQQQADSEVDSDASTDVPSRVPSGSLEAHSVTGDLQAKLPEVQGRQAACDANEIAKLRKPHTSTQSSRVKHSRSKGSTLASCSYQFEMRAALGLLALAATVMVEVYLR